MITNILLVIVALLLVGVLLAQSTTKKTDRLRGAGLYPQEGQETATDVDRLLQLGHKLHAIKVHRTLHGGGLKEAKTAVEKRQRELGLR